MEKDVADTSPQQQEYKAFVIGLSHKTTKPITEDFFTSKFPSLKKVEIVKKNKKTGKIKGYGFLILSSRDEFNALIAKKTYQVLDRVLFVKPYFTGKELEKFKTEIEKKRVFLKPVPLTLNDDDLFRAMESFGKVEDAFVAKDIKKGNISKGFGYATFEDVNSAKKAIEAGKVVYNDEEVVILEFKRKNNKGKLNSEIEEIDVNKEKESKKRI